MIMNNVVLVYNNRAYENNFELDVNVEEVEMPPQNGCRVFMPGTVAYSFTLPDFTNVLTTVKPYRFEHNGKVYFVFHTL